MTHDITITLDFSSYEYNADFRIEPDTLISSGNLVIDWGDNTSETVSPHEVIEHTYQYGNTYTMTIDGVSDIRDSFLSQNGDVTEVVLSSNIETIGNWFCIGTHITEMIIPNSITSIGDNFCDGSALNAIHIPSNVTTIGGYFCYMCSNLRAVSFSTGLTEIGEDFVGKTLVSRLEFPEGLSISGGFSDAPNINTIIYPSSIDDTGLLIFDNDYFAPQKIVFKSHTPPATANRWENFDGIVYVPEGCINSYIEYAIETDTFLVDSSYYKENLTLPRALDKFGTLMRANLKKQGIETQRNDGLTTLINKVNDIQDSNDIFEFDSANDYTGNGFGMMDDSGGHSYFTLKIPSTITTLGDASFDDFTEMKICEIPSSVVSIGNNVFNRNHSLEKIIFKGTTPPSATSSSFVTHSFSSYFNIPTTCVIEVPCNALSAYKSATNYPDPTVYTYQCIRFDEKCDSSNGLSNFESPILLGFYWHGASTMNYNSNMNAYALSGYFDDTVFPITQLDGQENFMMSCEINMSNFGGEKIGFAIIPPETGEETTSNKYGKIVYIGAPSNNQITLQYMSKKQGGVMQNTKDNLTINIENLDWIRLCFMSDTTSSGSIIGQVEKLDGTILGTQTFARIYSSSYYPQISNRKCGIYFLGNNEDDTVNIYIRNIKCIGY